MNAFLDYGVISNTDPALFLSQNNSRSCQRKRQ
jgi:hypothetical protein